MADDDSKEIRASRDFDKLGKALQSLVGQPCLRAGFTYGSELEVHFGEPQKYRHKMLADETKGSWILGALATPWLLSTAAEKGRAYLFGLHPWLPPFFAPAPAGAIEQELAALSGATVAEVTLGKQRTDLFVRFSSGTVLGLLTGYAEPDLDLPAWELFMPFGMFIQVWGQPAPAWSWLRSDVPQTT